MREELFQMIKKLRVQEAEDDHPVRADVSKHD